MNGNIITVVVVTASAVLNYLLTQPSGTFAQTTLLVLGAVSIALTTVSRFLPSQSAPIQVEVTKQAPVTPVEDNE